MYKKLLFASLLIAFVCVKLTVSLSCYQCFGESDCKKASLVTCNNVTANTTTHNLQVNHQNVLNVNGSTRFDCLNVLYTFGNGKTVAQQIKGCLHSAVNACGLGLKPEYSSQGWQKKYCNICSGNKCNKNPAGTFSSSVYTILATSLTLILAKVYA